MEKQSGRVNKWWAVAIAIGVLLAMLAITWAIAFYNGYDRAFGTWVPAGYAVHGIDVSRYQGNIDWETVAQTREAGRKISFAFMKATEGESYADSTFRSNWQEARKAGLLRGAYHFFRPEVPVAAQAHWFREQVRLLPGDLPPVLDVERRGDLSKSQLCQRVQRFLGILHAHYQRKPILYTGWSFYHDYLQNCPLEAYVWIARYRFHTQPPQLAKGKKWTFWQHAETGRVKGIPELVDLNVFHGSFQELVKLSLE